MGLRLMPASRKSVCLFAGSRTGTDPAYADAAASLGASLAAAGLRLVYGAGDAGLTAIAARAAAEAGGETLGVLPAHLRARDDVPEATLVVTETMHERKKVLFMNADAVAVLPGGAGTLDQLLEVLTWRQLGLHRKPVYLLNVAGYWDPLLALFDHVIAKTFAEPAFLRAFETFDSAELLAERLAGRLSRRRLDEV